MWSNRRLMLRGRNALGVAARALGLVAAWARAIIRRNHAVEVGNVSGAGE
jgi:hypothetical protein